MKYQPKHEARKNELMLQINQMIEREGFEHITIRGVCKELGISTGTFYHYFPEKNDLAQTLFTHIDCFFEHDVTNKFTENEIENLSLFFCEYCNYVVSYGVETCRCISIAPLQDNAKNYLDESRGLFVTLCHILERGSNNGQLVLPLGVTETARMLLIIARGYCADWVKHDGEYDLPSAMANFIHTFLPVLYNN